MSNEGNNVPKRAKTGQHTEETKRDWRTIAILIIVIAIIIFLIFGYFHFKKINEIKNTLNFPENKVIELSEYYSGKTFAGAWIIQVSPENKFHSSEEIGNDSTGIDYANGIVFSGHTETYHWEGVIKAMPLEKQNYVYPIKGKDFGLDTDFYFKP